MNSMKVRVDNVTKTYRTGGRSITAVRDCSFDVAEGEFLSILGPSGCGKSTLLRLIAGFEIPTKGGIYFEDRLCNGIIDSQRAMVFQEPTLFPWLTVKRNIAFGLAFKNSEKEDKGNLVKEYIAIMGLVGFEDRLPHELSGGMRQRAMLARTLVNNPQVLLMDEPFASVDAYTREILQMDLLRVWGEELAPTMRKTIIFVTHSIEEAIFLSDRVIVCTHRPTSLLMEVRPELARPRSREMIIKPYSVELKENLSGIMRDQVLKSREIERLEGA